MMSWSEGLLPKSHKKLVFTASSSNKMVMNVVHMA